MRCWKHSKLKENSNSNNSKIPTLRTPEAETLRKVSLKDQTQPAAFRQQGEQQPFRYGTALMAAILMTGGS